MRKIWRIYLLGGILFCLMGCGISLEQKEISQGNEIEELEVLEQFHWIAGLQIAEETNQIVVVSVEKDKNLVSLYEKAENGQWSEILSAEAEIGENGLGKTKEGDRKTPRGQYQFLFGFGVAENPGTEMPYRQVDDSYYWVDDSDSVYYNQFVSTKEVEKDWKSAEHIIEERESYKYVLALNYNKDCEPGKGSAIFLHCKPSGGAGCIAVPEDMMKKLMQRICPECVIIIDDMNNIYHY